MKKKTVRKRLAKLEAKAKRPASKRKNRPGAGRPRLELDEKKIEAYALAGCKNSEIAHLLGCDDETLKNNYSRILDKKRAERKLNLRKLQNSTARGIGPAAVTMQIWLGKNELEQADKQQIDGNFRHSHALSIEDLQASTAKYDEAGQ